MELKKLIFDLCDLRSPSGFEQAAFERVSKQLSPFVDEIKTDAMGNLIAVKKEEGAKKLLLDAHMDEIGLVTDVDKSGFLRFGMLGGIDPRMLPGREVRILTDPPMFGVIDTLPPHALEASDFDKTIDDKKLCIDAGLTQAEAEEKIPLGTPCVFATGCGRHLAGDVICGKSLDDRACVAIIIKAMEAVSRSDLDCDVYCLISTQEELGMRGITGAYSVDPDYDRDRHDPRRHSGLQKRRDHGNAQRRRDRRWPEHEPQHHRSAL